MTKQEVQKKITQNGKIINLDSFSWDKENNKFSSHENGLIINFEGIDNCVFKTGSNCIFMTGNKCLFITPANCKFHTGNECVFRTHFGCEFHAGSECNFQTGVNCEINVEDAFSCEFEFVPNSRIYENGNCLFNGVGVLTNLQ